MKQEATMPKPKRRSEDDEESILRVLKDGERMHFSMMAMDSGGEVLPARDAASTIDASAPLRVIDGLGRPAGQRPGACYLRPAAEGTPERAAQIARDHVRREARRQWIDQMTDAWRQPPPTPPTEPMANFTSHGSREFPGAQPGDQCMIDGQPGHLNHRVECIPDERRQDSMPTGPVHDAVEGQRVKDEAYRAMVDELVTAWQRKR
jgi:hypothetical protein